MIAVPEHGFVFLSTTKTGSTALENAFAPHASLMTRRPASLKHLNAQAFNHAIAPMLANHGFPRGSYDLICVIREPVDWTASWWRYRSRPEARGTKNYTGDLDFDTFADRIVSGQVNVGNMKKFVSTKTGEQAVNVLFRYENIDAAAAWMAAKIGIPKPSLRPANVSPDRQTLISPETRAKLEEHFAEHKALYESAR